MRAYCVLAVVAASLFVANSSIAQQADDAIAPFVDSETLVVMRAELGRIDENALADLLIDTVKDPGLDAPQRDMLRRWWRSWAAIGEGPASDFREAGVKRAYWVLTLQDLFDRKPTGVWVLPIEGGADAQRVIDVARRHKLEARRIGGVVVASRPGRAVSPGNATSLPAAWAHALAAGADAPIRIAIVPTEVLRKSFEENLPSLPIPGGPAPITTLTRGIEWIGISVTLAPNPAIRMVAQAPDAAAAQAVTGLVDHMLPAVQAQTPPIPPFLLSPAELARLLKPAVAGDQLRWEPDFQKVIAPIIARDVRQAARQRSAMNMRTIMQGLIMYANNHKGETPADLDALIKDQDMSPQVLIDPLNPSQKVGFVYIRPRGELQKVPPDVAVLYESAPGGLNVAFADGHVEWWPTRRQVEDLVKAAETRNRAAGEKK